MSRALLLAVAMTIALSGCGKKGAPSPVGPGDQITARKIYPTQ